MDFDCTFINPNCHMGVMAVKVLIPMIEDRILKTCSYTLLKTLALIIKALSYTLVTKDTKDSLY